MLETGYWIRDSGFTIQDSGGFRIQEDSGFKRIQDSRGFTIHDLRFTIRHGPLELEPYDQHRASCQCWQNAKTAVNGHDETMTIAA